MKTYFVYILSNKLRTALYIGVTHHLEQRLWQHRNGIGGQFTFKYNCVDLLYYESFEDIRDAIAREKQLKRWERQWKIDLIKKENPELRDLASDWF